MIVDIVSEHEETRFVEMCTDGGCAEQAQPSARSVHGMVTVHVTITVVFTAHCSPPAPLRNLHWIATSACTQQPWIPDPRGAAPGSTFGADPLRVGRRESFVQESRVKCKTWASMLGSRDAYRCSLHSSLRSDEIRLRNVDADGGTG